MFKKDVLFNGFQELSRLVLSNLMTSVSGSVIKTNENHLNVKNFQHFFVIMPTYYLSVEIMYDSKTNELEIRSIG